MYYVCMYVCTYVCMYVFVHVCLYVCMHACMYACMCLYACMYVYTYTHTYLGQRRSVLHVRSCPLPLMLISACSCRTLSHELSGAAHTRSTMPFLQPVLQPGSARGGHNLSGIILDTSMLSIYALVHTRAACTQQARIDVVAHNSSSMELYFLHT